VLDLRSTQGRSKSPASSAAEQSSLQTGGRDKEILPLALCHRHRTGTSSPQGRNEVMSSPPVSVSSDSDPVQEVTPSPPISVRSRSPDSSAAEQSSPQTGGQDRAGSDPVSVDSSKVPTVRSSASEAAHDSVRTVSSDNNNSVQNVSLVHLLIRLSSTSATLSHSSLPLSRESLMRRRTA
jgi:hypothetical protein